MKVEQLASVCNAQVNAKDSCKMLKQSLEDQLKLGNKDDDIQDCFTEGKAGS